MSASPARSRSRSVARLAAVQALYQLEMEQTPLPKLLREFHQHRIDLPVDEQEEAEFAEAERDFFDDVVTGVDARRAEIDALIAAHLATDWKFERLDRLLKQILRAGCYELLARADIPTAAVIDEYLDIADAFYDAREKKFVNGLLDAAAKDVRQ
ncbi:MAG: transcription antitermination factor NusB [Parasphingopyxis sp.]